MSTYYAHRKELIVLKSILNKYGFHARDFSLNGYAEMKICLNRGEDGWEVFIGERGNKFCLTIHSDLMSACLKVIDELADEELSEEIKRQYKAVLKYYQTKQMHMKTTRYATQMRYMHTGFSYKAKPAKVMGFSQKKQKTKIAALQDTMLGEKKSYSGNVKPAKRKIKR